MADIHVLDGRLRGLGVIYKRYGLHFQIPVEDRMSAAASDPILVAFESQVPNISVAELDEIKAGHVVEVVVVDRYHSFNTPSEVLQRVCDRYANLEPRIVARYVERYRYYLEERSSD